MRKRIRLGVGTVAALAALAFASQAFAAYSPKLAVQMGAAGTSIHLTIPSTDDPTALLVFYAPAGTVANLGATAGTTIGTLDAKAAAGALGGATLPLTGTVEARAADGTYLSSGVPVPLAAAATRCTGTASHAGFWVLKLSAAGQVLEVPLFVDPVSGALAVAASYSLTVCLPPSDIPESLGGAAFGAKVFEANFTVKGVFTATSGQNVWRLRATPYTPAKGTPNLPATVESQSYVETGSVALGTIKRVLTRLAASFTVAGKVTSSGAGAGASVTLAKGTSAAKVVTFSRPAVSAAGTFSSKLNVRRGVRLQRLYVKATASAPARDLNVSECKATFGVSCISATASGFTAVSSTKVLLVPKK
jgi:hypothetical protein